MIEAAVYGIGNCGGHDIGGRGDKGAPCPPRKGVNCPRFSCLDLLSGAWNMLSFDNKRCHSPV